MSGNLAAAFAYATDVTDPQNRAKGLGIVASAFGIGFAVGPPLGGLLGTDGGIPSMHWPGIASAVLSAIAFLGTIFLLPESLPKELRKSIGKAKAQRAAGAGGEAGASGVSPIKAMLSNPVLIGLVMSSLFVAIAAGAMQSVFQFWGRDLFDYSLRDIGVHFMVFALLSAVGQAGLVGPLVKRFGEKRLSLMAIGGVAVGLLLFATAQNDAMVWAAICVFGLANGLFLPVITSLVSFEADARSRGAVMGMFNASSSAGRIVGPALSGPVYFKLGPAAPFVISAVLAIIGAILLSRVRAKSAAG